MCDNAQRACGIYPEKRISCLRKNGQEARNISEMVDVLAEAFASLLSKFLVFGAAYPIRGSYARESQINFNFTNFSEF
ncbi:hypothetical protein AVEN_67106-1 [Araneus ventricosus]|uniref:Uncharacterized protein n=1 Tax=Araneus ventricosus TaxID=182803 RepID=A0A4Y2FTC8_ARAVE|nr:hypothetical protein AVEN_67106-1 [Araneus ventricosus]